jgi:hypothetical protein
LEEKKLWKFTKKQLLKSIDFLVLAIVVSFVKNILKGN